MDQQCPNCGSNYDYFDRKATIVCQNNHVICDMCVISLKKISGNCPYCNSAMVSTMSQDQSLYMGQPLEYPPVAQPTPPRQRVQPNPRPPAAQPQYQYVQPQQVQVQIQPQLPQDQRKNRGVFCGLSILFLFIFVILLAVTFQDSNNSDPSVGMIFGLIFSSLLCIIFFQLFMGRRRRFYGYNRF